MVISGFVRRLGWWCWGLWVWVLVCPAQAQAPFCDRTIRVALFDFGVLYRADKGDGVDARLIDKLAARTGCTVEYLVLPRARIWQELERGSVDLATAAIPTPERRQLGYLLPYFHTRNQALMRDVPAAPWQSLAEFEQSNARVGVVRSFRHEAAVDALVERLRPRGRVVETADVQENLRMLREGVVDVVFAQPLVYRSYLSDAELARLRVQEWVPPEQESVGALLLSRKAFSASQARAWDALLAQMLRDGSVLRIYEAFLTPRQAREGLYRGPRPNDF